MDARNLANCPPVIFPLAMYDCHVILVAPAPPPASEIVATYTWSGSPDTATYENDSAPFHATMCSSTLLPSSKTISLTAPIPRLAPALSVHFLAPTTHLGSPAMSLTALHALALGAFATTDLFTVPVLRRGPAMGFWGSRPY